MANVRGGGGGFMSLQSRVQVVVKGESGQNELFRGPLALFGVIHTAGFPLTITYKPGLKTHSTTSTIPDPGLPAASS